MLSRGLLCQRMRLRTAAAPRQLRTHARPTALPPHQPQRPHREAELEGKAVEGLLLRGLLHRCLQAGQGLAELGYGVGIHLQSRKGVCMLFEQHIYLKIKSSGCCWARCTARHRSAPELLGKLQHMLGGGKLWDRQTDRQQGAGCAKFVGDGAAAGALAAGTSGARNESKGSQPSSMPAAAAPPPPSARAWLPCMQQGAQLSPHTASPASRPPSSPVQTPPGTPAG